MSNANQEIIEARLASYIDDELDVGERAEIEQHLQQNPQYRRLLDDLRRGRQMLRALPRETAPAEFADAFFVQLERTGLLDGDEAPSPFRMRLDAWPRWVAAAAVVFLTVGLAGIVYYMLPHRDVQTVVYAPPKPALEMPRDPDESRADTKEEPRSTAQAPSIPNTIDAAATAPAASTPSAPVEVAKAVAPSGKGAIPVDRDLPTPAERELKSSPEAQSAAVPVVTASAPPVKDELQQLASAASHDPHVKDLLTEIASANGVANLSPAHSDDAVVMVVRAENPARVQRELNAYLASRNLEYQPVSPLVELALNASLANDGKAPASPMTPMNGRSENASAAGREKVSGIQRKNDGQTVAASPSPQAPGALAPTHADDSGGLNPGQVPAKPGPALQEQGAQLNQPVINNPAPVASAPPAAVKRALPATSAPVYAKAPAAPAFGAGRMPTTRPASAAASAIIARAAPAPFAADQQLRQQYAAAPTTLTSAAANTFVVVRRLSRLQAQELNDRLARAGEVRQAEVERRGTVAGENRFSEGVSNIATSIRPDGAGTGNSAHGTDALAKATDSAPAPTGADKGLPSGGAGLSRGAATGNGPTTRQASGVPLADATPVPADRPMADAFRRATAGIASQSGGGQATRPAGIDADRLIDVVIVMRSSPLAEPNLGLPAAPGAPIPKPVPSAPATQPATAPSVPFPHQVRNAAIRPFFFDSRGRKPTDFVEDPWASALGY